MPPTSTRSRAPSEQPTPSRPRATSVRDPDSLIKILISTDNHLGYLEKDTVRSSDSFRAFEEVLHIAKANSVDMLLLGGDLFHDNKPSRTTLVRTMRMLRSTCLSPDGAVRLAVRSDPSNVNYMRSSVAVSLPVFIIHGNHDDPTGGAGSDALSSLDLLSEAGLVTYFGKHNSSRSVEVNPILLQKGRTALALYGMGNIRDEVLYHTWAKQHQVKWYTPMKDVGDHARERHLPDTDTGGDGDLRWFNLFVLHQNRVIRGDAKGIAETLLPRWLDYVVWGHEHDSKPELTCTTPPVVQPGSTVATSLSHGEALPKHAILLEVYRGKLKHREIPLQTVRAFRFDDFSLNDNVCKEAGLTETDPEKTTTFLKNRADTIVEELQAEFDTKVAGFQNDSFRSKVDGVVYPPNSFYRQKLTREVRMPLVRMRVEISGNWETPNPQRFGNGFVGRAANHSDVLLYYRSRRGATRRTIKPYLSGYSADGPTGMDADSMALSQNGEAKDVVEIPKLVQYYLYHAKAGGSGLKFLELDELTGAVDEFVSKEENKAISEYVTDYLQKQQSRTLDEVGKEEKGYNETTILEKFRARASEAASRVLMDGAVKDEKDDKDSDKKESQGSGEKKDEANDSDEGAETRDKLEEIHNVLQANPKTAAITTAGRHRAEQMSEEEDEEDEVAPARTSTRGRGRGRGRARGRGRGRGRGASASAGTGTTVRRRRTAEPVAVPDSDDDGAGSDEVVAVEDDEEYVPVSSTSRKRRARAGSSSAAAPRTTRARRTSTARASSAAARGSASASRSGFAARGRRRATATIDVDEESGDDAM